MERTFAERLRHMRLPLVPLLPAIVVVVGVATAVAVGMLALWHLRTTADQLSSTRADVLASTLATRLRATAIEDRYDFARRAARRTGAEVLVCTQDGEIHVDATFGPPTRTDIVSLLIARQGEVQTRIGRTLYSSSPLGPPFQNTSVMVFVPAPLQPEGAQALVRSVAGLTALLIGVAAIVAFLFSRDLHADVDFVRSRIAAMADPGSSPAGEPVPIRVADQVGVLTHAFNVLVDRFTAAERAYQRDMQRVASLDRDRSAFLGALSHELRTPLNAILGFADILLSEVDGKLEADARENLEMVRSSGSHLRGLIDDILELSAIESGQLRLSRAMVDLRAIAEDVMREASARVIGKPITMTVTGDSPALVFADERRMWQILSNLVGNAAKFTARGSVSVNIEVGEREAQISVTDTGSGIPQADIEAIFDEYRQLGSSNLREKGAGLGLFIARKLVTMHGGTIVVRSELGQGSEFTVRVPVWGSGELAAAAGVEGSSRGRARILSPEGSGA
ncbi:MAG: HAMP domain-containing histidine kinase [Deltaproteobacteria bacterium]|nr:HAMP domain-containing histidine kinase [Deltaproteobacteria bacterium]